MIIQVSIREPFIPTLACQHLYQDLETNLRLQSCRPAWAGTLSSLNVAPHALAEVLSRSVHSSLAVVLEEPIPLVVCFLVVQRLKRLHIERSCLNRR